MDVGEKILLVGSALFVLYGAGGLVATWLIPSLQQIWLYRPWMLTGPLVANSINRTIMSLFSLIAGAGLGLPILGQTKLSLIALALLVVIGIAKSTFARRRPDA
jgi:hypothetical protein